MSTAHLIAGIAWDPQIRGFLAVLVGVVVLLGSVYLLLVTNLGVRLGFLIANAAFWGWLFIMGSVWWIYGNVGMLGDHAKWEVKEIVYPGLQQADLEEARGLDTSVLPAPNALDDLEGEAYEEVRAAVEPKLDGWKLLPEANPAFGEAKATVDEHFAEEPLEDLEIDNAEDYVTVYSFERGGKDPLDPNPNRIDRILHKLHSTFVELKHPPHYAIVQIQRVIDQEAEPGKPPPTPTPDEATPVVSVIMERNLGDVRLPGAMLTISSGIMFAIFCTTLHRRDQRVAEVRGMLPAATEA